MVLIQNPLRARSDSKIVGRQLDETSASSWKGSHRNVEEEHLNENFLKKRPLTSLRILHMFHGLSGVDPRIVEIPTASTSFSQFHLVKPRRNLNNSWKKKNEEKKSDKCNADVWKPGQNTPFYQTKEILVRLQTDFFNLTFFSKWHCSPFLPSSSSQLPLS